MNKKLIIIGCGLTGLSAGIYARMHGYETIIFEGHNRPGGVCTSWNRKGYTFDGAFHWWLGSVPESPFYKFFEEVGIFPETKPIRRDIYTVIKTEDKREFTVFSNMEKLKNEMLNTSPEDNEEINIFFSEIEKLSSFNFPMNKPMEAFTVTDWLRFYKENSKLLKKINEYMKTSIEDYAGRFSNQDLKYFFKRIFGPECPIFVMMNFLGAFNIGDGTFPEGGALKFVKRMEKKYLELGGQINYGKRVKKIIVKKNRAAGAELTDNSIHNSDWVLSAADGHSTIFDMLKGRYLSGKIKKIYDETEIFKPLVQVSFGADSDLSNYPHSYLLQVKDKAAGMDIRTYSVRHYCYDKTMAPPDKSVVTVLIETELEPWLLVSDNNKKYLEYKNEYAAKAKKTVESVYPKIKIEVTDVATPLTTIRYTNNWKASYEGFTPTVKNLNLRVPKTLPCLKNFRMAGQWTEPGGGIPAAVWSGRNAVYMICRKDRLTWKLN